MRLPVKPRARNSCHTGPIPVATVLAETCERDHWRSWCVQVCPLPGNGEIGQRCAPSDGQAPPPWPSLEESLLAESVHSLAERAPDAALVIPRNGLARH